MADKETDIKSEVWRSLRHNRQAQVRDWFSAYLKERGVERPNVTCSHEMSLDLKFAISDVYMSQICKFCWLFEYLNHISTPKNVDVMCF